MKKNINILKIKSKAKHARADWEEEFKKMAAIGDDKLLDLFVFELKQMKKNGNGENSSLNLSDQCL